MTPAFVIDCSVTMAWCFADETTSQTTAALNRMATESAVVPPHWYLEVANVLVGAERKRRISAADAQQFLQLLSTFDIRPDDADSRRTFDRVLPLCRAHGLTSYDAAYLDLALRTNLPLATLDDGLRAAAKKAGVQLLGK